MFKKYEWTKELVAFAVLGQLFSEDNDNATTGSTNDPFLAESAFRLNHHLVRQLTYKCRENIEMKVEVLYQRNNVFIVKYEIQDSESKEKTSGDFSMTGKYMVCDNDFAIECCIDRQVSLLPIVILPNSCISIGKANQFYH